MMQQDLLSPQAAPDDIRALERRIEVLGGVISSRYRVLRTGGRAGFDAQGWRIDTKVLVDLKTELTQQLAKARRDAHQQGKL